MNIFQLIKERSENWSKKPAIHDEFGVLSYGDLLKECQQLSHRLKEQGISEGMALAIQAKNSREFIIAILAGLDCQVTVLPLSHKLTQDEIEEIFKETRLHVFLSPQSTAGNDITVGTKTWKLFFKYPFEQPFAPHVDHPAFIRFSSGTTGKSKGVIISHQSVLERIEAANKRLHLGTNDNVIWVLPVAYHFVVSIILYLYYGSAITLCNDFTASAIIHAVRNFKGTLLYCSPMHIRLLAGAKAFNSLNPLNRVISTSSGISTELCEMFKQRYDIPVSQAFGIIEVGLPIINLERSGDYPGAVGYALPDYQVEILDKNYQCLPSNHTGQLAIKGPGMFDGYLSPPQKREEILHEGWFLTGDLASKTEDGLIKIEGREKSMINVTGNKVFPEEVEAIINAHPAVQASKVKGEIHALTGEIVTAEVVLKKGQQLQVEALLHFCRKKLASFKIPQRVRFVDAIEKTGSGKVKRV